jgi:hypothetical protein
MTVLVLGWDLADRMAAPPPPALLEMPVAPGEEPVLQPFLPSVRPDVGPPDVKRAGRTPEAELRKPMTIELVAGGGLQARGTITPGTAARFAAELDKRGDYVRTVVLNSPGGSVDDALAMGRLIRVRKLDTRVEGTALCASSCPLVFAGASIASLTKGRRSASIRFSRPAGWTGRLCQMPPRAWPPRACRALNGSRPNASGTWSPWA